MTFSKILLAIDNSKLNQTIVNTALEIAKIHQAKLLLFRCVTDNKFEVMSSDTYEMGLAFNQVDSNYQGQQTEISDLTKQALEQLKNECEIATNHAINIEYQYRIGEPGYCICEMAQEWGASLIIVGRRGYSGLLKAFVGSVSNYVVHHAPCPVLVIQLPKN